MIFAQSKQFLKQVFCLWVAGLLLGQGALAAGSQLSFSHEIKHGSDAGGRGEDSVFLLPPELAGVACVLFEKASVDYQKRRFGEATIVSQPERGCNPLESACQVQVLWRHAPAGQLNYRVRADWTVRSSGC